MSVDAPQRKQTVLDALQGGASLKDAADAQRYAKWLRENAVVKAPPTRTRRQAIAEELRGLEKSIERRQATAKHAPTKRDAEKIQDTIDRLEERAMRLEQELSDPEPKGSCVRCGADVLDRTESDYGLCRRCRLPINPERSHSD